MATLWDESIVNDDIEVISGSFETSMELVFGGWA
jgi:hypothetical protein